MASLAYRSRIPQVMAEMEARAIAAVKAAGFMIERGAKQRARVDTGFMRGEIRSEGEGLSIEVVAGADYSSYHEFGTVHMAAQPMLVPAVEETRPHFLAEMRRITG